MLRPRGRNAIILSCIKMYECVYIWLLIYCWPPLEPMLLVPSYWETTNQTHGLLFNVSGTPNYWLSLIQLINKITFSIITITSYELLSCEKEYTVNANVDKRRRETILYSGPDW
uniref:RbcSF1 ribulose-1,5-biphosphate carboxylase/oxygenase small subunit n=1 Tax=Brassica napus TaxID=3708 RepID=Q04295_BRANA|nr:unnamed protein product [Brassica napus]